MTSGPRWIFNGAAAHKICSLDSHLRFFSFITRTIHHRQPLDSFSIICIHNSEMINKNLFVPAALQKPNGHYCTLCDLLFLPFEQWTCRERNQIAILFLTTILLWHSWAVGVSPRRIYELIVLFLCLIYVLKLSLLILNVIFTSPNRISTWFSIVFNFKL